ncbi:MAG: hypothetical protein IPK32_00940 [Verrucomicrobiaceae bacterium]|nr:hypothetical protein [Verrucomicrobiaceae bacterium]
MTVRQEKELPLAIITSTVVHVLVFLFLAWLFSVEAQNALRRLQEPPVAKTEPILLYPEQLMPVIVPPAPPPIKKTEIYIRTTQNNPQTEKPKDSAFISDRNTKASSKLGPAPGADKALPTTEGIAIPMNDLANRDYRDGEIKEDSAPAQNKVIVRDAPRPTAIITPPQPQVAKNTPPKKPLLQMMEETDAELASRDQNRLKIEVKRAEQPEMKEPDSPPPQLKAPQMRETEEVVAKAIAIPQEEVRSTVLTPKDNAYMPHTRTSEIKGTISNRGSEDSVDAEDSPKGRYIRSVQDMIGKKWNIYRVMKREAVTYGSLQVIVFINSRSKVEEIRIVNDKQSNPLLTEFSLSAIRDAELPPMPKEVRDQLPLLEKKCLKMDYNILIY